ncbi:MAG: DNA helicase RecQ [Alphaproteobacteria bacterium]|nr:MAG: DNA helicase RecQ [Alphaproteobacteria bacterium]
MSQNSARTLLKDVFGYEDFREKQSEIIARLFSGENILTVMPTGAGKSLCFQIPALMGDGLTIVISPLISLMQNQVEALKLLGVEAATINSTNSPEVNRGIWQKMQAGTLKLLYLSPEKLMTERMLDVVRGLNVNFFAIDEAHCISQWGAAFRPEYEGLSRLHKIFPHVPIIALTATADQATREQICEKIFSDNVKTYLTGFDRPNISLNVEIKNGWKQQLMRFLKNRQNENGIIYCLSRKKTEEAANMLVEKGYNALVYHAGMSGQRREENLNRFMTEPDLIMVATIAFGMGIDKPDIRFVFHTDLPASPEAYYQEIGRAGRDGQPAVAHMLYGMDDIRMRRMFIDDEAAGDDHKRRGHQRLNALLAYAEAPECRRYSLLHYFGDEPDFERCGNCDLCDNPKETLDATETGQKFISAIYRTGQYFGVGHIVDILTGKVTVRIEQLGHDDLPTFGIGKDLGINEWKSVARQLMARGFVISDMTHGSLKISDKGFKLLKGEADFRYRPDVILKKARMAKTSKAKKAIPDLPEEAQGLFQALKRYRKEIAAERHVPAYIIFSDKSLVDMAINQPVTLDQFGDIYGVGAGKKEEFGEKFIQFICENKENLS